MGIAWARQCGATIVGLYVIYAPSHSELGIKGTLGKGAYEKIKKFVESAKKKAAQNGIVLQDKIMYAKEFLSNHLDDETILEAFGE